MKNLAKQKLSIILSGMVCSGTYHGKDGNDYDQDSNNMHETRIIGRRKKNTRGRYLEKVDIASSLWQ